eukprot:1499003-Pyramimonas_sp.AAC.1
MMRRTGLLGVLDENGTPCASPEAATAALVAHWSKVFAQADRDPTHRQEILAHVHTPEDSTPAPRWKFDAGEFRDRVGHKFHSAPGPDGIPYGCWKVLEDTVALFEVYEEVFYSAWGCTPP